VACGAGGGPGGAGGGVLGGWGQGGVDGGCGCRGGLARGFDGGSWVVVFRVGGGSCELWWCRWWWAGG
jgi:hypothetical protein